MDSILVEIRAGEGGEDARLLVDEQLNIYAKMGARRGLWPRTCRATLRRRGVPGDGQGSPSRIQEL